MLHAIVMFFASHAMPNQFEAKNEFCAWTWTEKAGTGLTYVQQDEVYRQCMETGKRGMRIGRNYDEVWR
jgi:hypothetical protein